MTDLARAFGMTVLWAEHQGREPRNDDYTAFDEVLARADVLSLHCPLNEQTEHLINKETSGKNGQTTAHCQRRSWWHRR
nr:NAD(P)-dependent oxidoreductase [Psychrobacter proteolyticus]